jgi:hypothetical protein
MKLPAVAIAGVFASGIAKALWSVVANRASWRGFYFGVSLAVLLLIATAAFFLSRQYLCAARNAPF